VCKESGNAFFCAQHSDDHATKTIGHDLIDSTGRLKPKVTKRLKGDYAPGIRTIVLITEYGWDRVLVSDGSPRYLYQFGYMGNSPVDPCMFSVGVTLYLFEAVAFHVNLLGLCKHLVTSGRAAIDSIARTFFETRFKQAIPSRSIRSQFSQAYRAYEYLDHRLDHLRLTPEVEKECGPGITECPACTPREDFAGVLTFVRSFVHV
jgi:hypothetical protein